jgi:hypothetical protein
MASLSSSDMILKGDMAIANYTNLPTNLYVSNKIGGKKRKSIRHRSHKKRKSLKTSKKTLNRRRRRRHTPR